MRWCVCTQAFLSKPLHTRSILIYCYLYMPVLHISLSHALGKKEALKRIKTLIKTLKADHKDMVSNVHEQWKDNTGSFGFDVFGQQVQGQLHVTDSKVIIDGQLPWMARMFASKIEATVKMHGKKLLT